MLQTKINHYLQTYYTCPDTIPYQLYPFNYKPRKETGEFHLKSDLYLFIIHLLDTIELHGNNGLSLIDFQNPVWTNALSNELSCAFVKGLCYYFGVSEHEKNKKKAVTCFKKSLDRIAHLPESYKVFVKCLYAYCCSQDKETRMESLAIYDSLFGKSNNTDFTACAPIFFYNFAMTSCNFQLSRVSPSTNSILGYALKCEYAPALTTYATLLYSKKNFTDKEHLLEIFELSAKHGCPKAMCNTGRMYETGYGCEKNMTKAKEWYQKASDCKNKKGMLNYARMLYDSGSNIDQAFDLLAELHHCKENIRPVINNWVESKLIDQALRLLQERIKKKEELEEKIRFMPGGELNKQIKKEFYKSVACSSAFVDSAEEEFF